MKLKKKPRYISLDKCTGCGECANVCPVELEDEYNLALSKRKAIYKLYPQAIPGTYCIQKGDKAPCRLTCPAGINVQGYVQMIKVGDYKRALELIMEKLPFPGVLGRICPHPCEERCRRKEIDEAISIRELKRFVADTFDPRKIEINRKPKRKEKVAIIGGGPAGLSCAYHLAKKGISSTIFEAAPELGGMLRYGIPDYRLPKDILRKEIEIIENLEEVEVKTNTVFGKDITLEDLWKQGYKAIFLAIGAQKGIKLGIPGEEAEGVVQGIDFLRELNQKGKVDVGKNVVVIGGGNVAIDVARSAIRLGAEKVRILYRRTRSEMPASEEEVKAAEEEGVEIIYLTAPKGIIEEGGKIKQVECIKMELGEPDETGRRRPIPIEGSEHKIDTDQLILAIGQRPDTSYLEKIGLKLRPNGTVEADPISLETNIAGVFAGGDFQAGPWIAIGAIAHGMEAAESIERYLDGRDLKEGREKIQIEKPNYRSIPEKEERKERKSSKLISLEKRRNTFQEVEIGLKEEDARDEAKRCINCGYCCECLRCVDACKADAINHNDKEEEIVLNVGSIIISSGAKAFDPSKLEEFYHYKSYPNVVTSLEFERLLSASGPTMGKLLRPSDGKEPKRIAWIQCIGSRDVKTNPYCSSVCCMYAVKEAIIAKEHVEGVECTIFFMDMRTFGKDYEKYYERAKKEGVRFIRARIHTIFENEDKSLILRYVDEDGDLKEEIFDMVVLSVGFESSLKELSDRLGIRLNEYGFVETDPFCPIKTSREGIFVSGIVQAPKDIPTSVAEASAASCAAQVLLSDVRWQMHKKLEIPEERDVEGEEPRIGVFICNCGINIGGVIDVPSVTEYASHLPYVVHAEHNLFTCSEDSQARIKEIIKEYNMNRVVVASCSPRTHEPIFQQTLQECGLNKYLFEMANIRDQDSWVHGDDPRAATEKAKDLIRMAVMRAVYLRPLKEKKISIIKRAVVIGGGIAGMNAALSLADQGFETVIIEKEPQLGGFARELTRTIDGIDIQRYLKELIDRVTNHEKIQVLTQAIVVGFSGFKGNFTTEVIVGPGMYERTIEHGALLIATGAREYKPEEYLYGKDHRVFTQVELSKRLEIRGADGLKRVVMIQCVGSRNEKNPNCSRVCCQSAIKNALHIKELNPETEVIILYRDIRMYGFLERYYREAREKGVLFFRYEPKDPPKVESTEEGIKVTFRDPIIQRDLVVHADILALSAGVVAEDTEELSSILKLQRNEEGYFMEAHVKLRPVDMVNDGVFVCGMAHSPKLIPEAIAQGLAAASRAATFLAQDSITLSAITAKVNPELCAACLVCVRVCPFGVPKINEEGVSEIDEALCRGCGICASECPAKAIQLSWYEDDQIISKIDALLEGEV